VEKLKIPQANIRFLSARSPDDTLSATLKDNSVYLFAGIIIEFIYIFSVLGKRNMRETKVSWQYEYMKYYCGCFKHKTFYCKREGLEIL
jgi:hypothetical protein